MSQNTIRTNAYESEKRVFGHNSYFFVHDAEVCMIDKEIGLKSHRIKVNSGSNHGLQMFADKMGKRIANIEIADNGRHLWVSLQTKEKNK